MFSQNGSMGYCIKREFGTSMVNGRYFDVYTFINNCDKPLILEVEYSEWYSKTRNFFKKKKLKPHKKLKITLVDNYSGISTYRAYPVSKEDEK
jgi:hypothetical protein